MGKFEKIILALVCIALILTLQLIEGGAFLLFITALLLSLLYFPFGFLLIHRIGLKKMFKSETYQAIKFGHIIIAVVAGIALIYAYFRFNSMPNYACFCIYKI
jgi:hypothetical protein